MFLSLTLFPICIFGFLSGFYIRTQVQNDAMEKTSSVTERMAQTIQELTGTLEVYKITTNSDARFHLALLTALDPHSTKNIDMADLTASIQALYYSLSTKPYVHSLLITTKDSPYYINGLSRETFGSSVDDHWADEAFSYPGTSFFKLRHIRKNKFDTTAIPIVTAYQHMKYQELMAVNIRQEYFNKWLDSITDYEGQILLITDRDGQIFFSNRNLDRLAPQLAADGWLLSGPEQTAEAMQETYFSNTGILSSVYGLTYLSLIPRKEVFKLSNTIQTITIVGILLSILVSSVLAYIYTLKDCRQLFRIIDLFDKAEKGEYSAQQPPDESETDNAYFRIINNIIRLFMSKTYLKVQLDAKKYALMTAQLSALQYQLNPHFLFNTLQSIDLEILKAAKRPTAANAMIAELSELLRYSLNAPTAPVPLREEIHATDSYIRLQALRSGEPFQVVWDYTPELLDVQVPRLLLQPIIENSIIHSSLSDPADLRIKLRFRVHEGTLTITVIDNGRGMETDQLALLRKSIQDDQVEANGRHIGLKNISQRIRLTYPDGQMKLWSRKGLGTIVKISRIPL